MQMAGHLWWGLAGVTKESQKSPWVTALEGRLRKTEKLSSSWNQPGKVWDDPKPPLPGAGLSKWPT